MRRHAGEHSPDPTHPEPGLVDDVVGVGVGLDRGVHAVEHAGHGQALLGGVTLLSRGGLQDDAAGQRAGLTALELCQREEGPHGVGAHDVVTAAVADAGQSVELGQDRDRAHAFLRSDLRPQGRIHPEDRLIRLDPVLSQHTSHSRDGVVLGVTDLRMGVDIT